MRTYSGDSIFDIPELVDMIACHLSRSSLAMTIATCRRLAQHLEPFLWKHVAINYRPPLRDSVLRHRHQIQTLSSSVNQYYFEPLMTGLLDLKPWSSNWPNSTKSVKLPNLVRLELDGEDNDESYIGKPLSLLQYCPNLTRLNMSCTAILWHEKIAKQFNELLPNNLRHLEHLELNGNSASVKMSLPLLEACILHPQLQELHCRFKIRVNEQEFMGWMRFNDTVESMRAGNRWSGYSFVSKIKSLTLPSYKSGFPMTFLTQLLKVHLRNIVSLVIPVVYRNVGISEEEAFKGLCPKLQHLSWSFAGEDTYNFETIEAFVTSGSKEVGLKTFSATFCSETGHFAGSNDAFLGVLADHHSESLEEIELFHCQEIESYEIKDILTSCRKLKRLWITPGYEAKISLYLEDIASEPWVCSDLKELWMTLCRDNLEEAKAIGAPAYAQIGRMVKLETLFLGFNKNEQSKEEFEAFRLDLTLEDGWLAELGGLAELQHFGMAEDFWSKMGQAEVEFIYSSWPRLKKITFGSIQRYYRKSFEQLPHWQWLRKNKPFLEFEYDEWTYT